VLGFLLDIAGALENDRELPLDVRHRRDRALALEHSWQPQGGSSADRLQALRGWWRAVGAPAVAQEGAGLPAAPGVDRARRLGLLLLVVLGLACGAAATSIGLRYDGSAPVNLVGLLGVLVFLPAVLLLATLALLPGRLPGLGWLQDVFASFSPGQWVSAWLNRRAPDGRFGWFGGPGTVAAAGLRRGLRDIGKWQLLLFGQAFAVAFFVASLVVIALRVTFSDLTFGWSTTLRVAPESVVAFVAAASAPFQALWPAAVPDPELVRLSQFNRAADLAPEQVSRLGDWWPFLLAAVALYGLLPRLLLALLAGWRLRATQRRVLFNDARVQQLFERMATAVVDHQVDQPETVSVAVPGPRETPGAGGAQRIAVAADTTALLNWNDAVAPDALPAWCAAHLGGDVAMQLALSTQTPLAQEQARLEALTAQFVVVLVKAWEPPLLEFVDFAGRVQAALGPEGRVLVVPVGLEGQAPAPMDLSIWTQTLGRGEDVRIGVWQWGAATTEVAQP
jgi:hypothetical protein